MPVNFRNLKSKEDDNTKLIIEGDLNEIAALVLGVQERRDVGLRDPMEGLNGSEDSLQHHSKPEE